MAHEIRVRDQDSRRVIVSFEYADRLARLHQQRFVVLQILQRRDDGAISFPTARGASRPAVNHQVPGTLGNLFVEVVHEHAHGRFLLPSFAGDGVASRRANGGWSLDFRFNGHG